MGGGQACGDKRGVPREDKNDLDRKKKGAITDEPCHKPKLHVLVERRKQGGGWISGPETVTISWRLRWTSLKTGKTGMGICRRKKRGVLQVVHGVGGTFPDLGGKKKCQPKNERVLQR